VGSDGSITTDLETDYSTIVNFVNNFPVIGTRRAQSTLRVRDGDSIVIAGLFSDLDTATLSKVPLLGDLPFLGEIFKNHARTHTKDQVVFLITPHLVQEP
jgi:type II secretory pathway component GspD/PulD (secretin)